MWLIGIPLGVLLGALSGYFFLLILKAGFKAGSIKQIGTILGELTGLVVFSLGGSWFAEAAILRKMLPDTEAKTSDVLSPYLLVFTLVFFGVVCVPFYRTIVRYGREIAAHERTETTEKGP